MRHQYWLISWSGLRLPSSPSSERKQDRRYCRPKVVLFLSLYFVLRSFRYRLQSPLNSSSFHRLYFFFVSSCVLFIIILVFFQLLLFSLLFLLLLLLLFCNFWESVKHRSVCLCLITKIWSPLPLPGRFMFSPRRPVSPRLFHRPVSSVRWRQPAYQQTITIQLEDQMWVH